MRAGFLSRGVAAAGARFTKDRPKFIPRHTLQCAQRWEWILDYHVFFGPGGTNGIEPATEFGDELISRHRGALWVKLRVVGA